MQTALEKPARRTPAAIGCYFYAVIDSKDEGPLDLTGLDGGPVYTLSDGCFAAVVSYMPNAKVRPERRRLAAHHEVLKALRQRHTVLPMAFGVIGNGPDAIRRILTENRDAFSTQVLRVAGKVEMGLRVVWDVPNIFEYIVDINPELRQLRDRMFRHGREPGHDEKVELGRMFDRVLTEERAEQTEKVLVVLRPHCEEVKENKVRNEREVMNLACLIGTEVRREFEEAVIEAAGRFDNHYAFDFNGPWPPHNFVEIDLKM